MYCSVLNTFYLALDSESLPVPFSLGSQEESYMKKSTGNY